MTPITHERLIELGFEHRPEEGDHIYWHEATSTIYELLPTDGIIKMHMPEPDVINLDEPRLLAFIYAMTGEDGRPMPKAKLMFPGPKVIYDYEFRPKSDDALRGNITTVTLDSYDGSKLSKNMVDELGQFPSEGNRHFIQKFGKEERELLESILTTPLTHDDIVKAGWELKEDVLCKIYRMGDFEMEVAMVAIGITNVKYNIRNYYGSSNITPSDLHTIMRLLNINI